MSASPDRVGSLPSEVPSPALHPELELIQKQIADFGKFARSPAGFPMARPADCRTIIDAISRFLGRHRSMLARWDSASIAPLMTLLDEIERSDIRSYPNEAMRLSLLRAEFLLIFGRAAAAAQILEPLAARPYLIEGDFDLVTQVFELDLLARLSTGGITDIEPMLLYRLLYLIRWRRYRDLDLFRKFHAALALVSQAEGPLLERVAARCARSLLRIRITPHRGLKRNPVLGAKYLISWLVGALCLRLSVLIQDRPRFLRLRLSGIRPAVLWRKGTARLAELLAPGPESVTAIKRSRYREQLAIPIVNHAIREVPRPTRQDILVTRAMGGLGDIIMMTPGLHARAVKEGRPIYFATKKQFFPILQHDPAIHLIDIESEFDVSEFGNWINLSVCPAGAYESRTRPNVRRGRVELFARKIGASKADLDRYGWRPRCFLSPEQLALRDRFVADLGPHLPKVAVQPFSRDTYKNAPHLFEAIQALAATAKIAVFHTGPLEIPLHPNITQYFDRPLSETIAMIAGCDYLIAVDSAFYHLAAAFGIPTLGIFGPTDGETFSVHHPKHLLAAPIQRFPCSPCWRNEDIPCYLTKLGASACLESVTADRIVAGFRDLASLYPLDQIDGHHRVGPNSC